MNPTVVDSILDPAGNGLCSYEVLVKPALNPLKYLKLISMHIVSRVPCVENTGAPVLKFSTLECDRLRVHRNLVASLIIRFVVMLVLTEPFVSNRQTSYRDVDWLCKTLLAVRMYAQMASINWMFVEGLFLHSRLTSNVFDSGAPFPLYYTIGWGVPLVFIVAWAVTMSLHYPVHCWEAYPTLKYTWILVAPMVTALMINLLFLINIIRILVTKLRASDAQVRQHRNYQLKQHHNLRQRKNIHTAKDNQQTDVRGSGHEDEQQPAFDLQRTKGKKTQYTCCGCLPCRRFQRPVKKTNLQVVTKKPVIQITYYEDEHQKPKYSQRETSTTLYYERDSEREGP
ncbi:secretin receptor-like [Penaeus chinensis]|uniref:secretin receptor-like n=1 Tax=Penaeus chinensis TaxID=139456 RepID=UPI001FB60461|nr:secretin receptor-like [Penaeus chinensis]